MSYWINTCDDVICDGHAEDIEELGDSIRHKPTADVHATPSTTWRRMHPDELADWNELTWQPVGCQECEN